ncbi:hypothetical protein PIB30_089842 [Stylosanthes scabra]|uniref:Uncharacterized protein n=1 Tax=Stylosanthes scabra TaxID=79078 RepID=A0ABU6SVI4_9FABA|nr:hypothetical protein [Stylosanthes scabra]
MHQIYELHKEEKRQEAKFKSLYHEDRFNKYIKHREVLVEAEILIDTNELSPISEQINKRKWQRLIKPLQAVGYTLMREFYANALVMESERHLPLPYTSMIRGKKINFSPGEIHKAEMRKQLNLWTRNASVREAYSCWAHQQANPNLSEIPVNHIPDLMQTNAERGRPMFYGALKSHIGTSASSQSAQQEPVPLRTAPPLPGYQPPHGPPN